MQYSLIKPSIISPLLDKIEITDLKKSVENIFNTIKHSNNFDLSNNIKGDVFIDHGYEKDNRVNYYIYNNNELNIKSDGLVKYLYVESCSWLFFNIEKNIENMINNRKSEIKQKYYIHEIVTFENWINILAFTTDPKKNTCIQNIQNIWNDMQYELPFHYVRSLLEKKGYYINVYSNKIHKHLNDDSFREKPIEIFELEIKIIKKEIGKIRDREE